MTINYYAPFGNGNLWRNITDLDDTTYGQIAIIGGKRKLVVGDSIGELCLVGGKRRYWVEVIPLSCLWADNYINVPIEFEAFGIKFHAATAVAAHNTIYYYSSYYYYHQNAISLDGGSPLIDIEAFGKAVFRCDSGVIDFELYYHYDRRRPTSCNVHHDIAIYGNIVNGSVVGTYNVVKRHRDEDPWIIDDERYDVPIVFQPNVTKVASTPNHEWSHNIEVEEYYAPGCTSSSGSPADCIYIIKKMKLSGGGTPPTIIHLPYNIDHTTIL